MSTIFELLGISGQGAAEPATSRGPGGVVADGRGKVFDPALKHFQTGVIPGDPRFATAEDFGRWQGVYQDVLGHVLRSVAESPWRDRLVLRGSAVMGTWFGEAARAPKDLDFVVLPESLEIGDAEATALFEGVIDAVTSRPCPGVTLSRKEVATDSIWTYERVPGMRLVFRWTSEEVPWGSAQLDFVFGEALAIAPESLDVRLGSGPPARFQVATKALSLAWKLEWLVSDMHPQAKDLYDAMLLAESGPLLRQVEGVYVAAKRRPPTWDDLMELGMSNLEWVGFDERASATELVQEWKRRLVDALWPPP